jgi:hypothetical protein
MEEIIKKKVRHTFTAEERTGLSQDLLGALSDRTNAEAEFDSIKAQYKAKVTAAEARVESVAATLRTGWEFREKLCKVELVPEKRQKFFYLADDEAKAPLIWEDMNPQDWQLDLIRAESKFDPKSEIVLWDAPPDKGIIVVGKFENRWYSAVRLSVGANSLEERLDSEQTAMKDRFIAIQRAESRAKKWLKDNLKETAKGFEDPISKAVEAEREKVE